MKLRLSPIFKCAIACATALLALGCSPGDTFGEGLEEARKAIDNGQTESAQKICDNLFEEFNGTKTSASKLGRLSLLFMELANTGASENQENNIASATQCYLDAFAVDADSATAFYQSIDSPSDMERYVTLNLIARAVITPDSTSFEYYVDNDSAPEFGAQEFDSIPVE